MSKQRLRAIIEKILAGKATAEEIAEISSAIEQDHVSQLVEDIHDLLSKPEDEEIVYHEKKWDAISARILKADEITEPRNASARVVRLIKKIAIGAVVFFAVATGVCYLVERDAKDRIAYSRSSALVQDTPAPQHSNAVLTLSSGKKIELERAGVGSLSQEGSVDVMKLGAGEIGYKEIVGNTRAETVYNTLAMPKGSKLVAITLEDGTKVWLNNESSLRYPTSFNGNERRVEITGEAYFEVARNEEKPFIVSSGETTMEVTGSRFNVNAYTEQDCVKVTLLEGAGNVTKAGGTLKLQPGQQARIKQSVELSPSCNLGEVMAWKNEMFAFYDADIKTVMDQLARWYDLDVVFTGNIKEKFDVEITRNTNVSNVYKMLEGTGGVHFKFEENKIYVMR